MVIAMHSMGTDIIENTDIIDSPWKNFCNNKKTNHAIANTGHPTFFISLCQLSLRSVVYCEASVTLAIL